MIDNNKTNDAPKIPNPINSGPGQADDPDELTDQELEWVVGGTDPDFAKSQFEQLQKPAEPPASPS